ncbi:hypothetical protein GWN63_04265 [Candidatus Bathyarchaeota archaeon]|nr:hypothetical protein [Candidatus Bathyarchaeota archaeon]NIR15475.1 hypothetical protein [Desulfobacterales bacterium]NIU81444.1 hypothetical protein [Candidatus Bathyarchaeota archaeon]NIV67333.1 hypothetical protein [Candidatus Bathyarchaeota archaeon]NIW16486.1 hypothetical protein [Candidatus Bathyarchaeota archaeon]
MSALESLSIQNIGDQEHEFNELLLECLEEGLREIFGNKGAQIILDYINRQYRLRSRENAERLEAFRIGLSEFLGSGAVVVEHKVMKIMYSKLEE